MFDSLGQLGGAFIGFINPHTLFNVMWATFLGIVTARFPASPRPWASPC